MYFVFYRLKEKHVNKQKKNNNDVDEERNCLELSKIDTYDEQFKVVELKLQKSLFYNKRSKRAVLNV